MIHSSRRSENDLQLVVLAGLSGLLYSSWPIGYVLNPSASAGLVSNLGGIGQPYNWLFILLDIVSGLLITVVAWLILRGRNRPVSTLIRYTIFCYGAFGLLTAIDAVLPEDCLVDQHQCGAILSHPLVVLHGLVSLASIGCLTLSLLGVWWLVYKLEYSRLRLQWLLSAAVLIWFFFGLYTAYLLALDQTSAWTQHIFIFACSVWTVVFPLLIYWLVHQCSATATTPQLRKNRGPVARRVKNQLDV